jgi:hypothetical protein
MKKNVRKGDSAAFIKLGVTQSRKKIRWVGHSCLTPEDRQNTDS